MSLTATTLPPVAWLCPARLRRPAQHQLLVLRVRVAACASLAALGPDLLPPDELARAGRYLHAADRLRFVVARAALRAVVGSWLDLAPAAVRLGVGTYKKPFLASDPSLHFSLAHTRDWVLLALAGAPLGADVEHLDPAFPFAEVLPVSFSAAEQAAILQAPDPCQRFYQLWTRKEALVKATGQGLDDTLPTLPVLDGTHPGPVGSAWRIASFAVADNHPAALAYPAGEAWELQFAELTPQRLLALVGA